MTTDHAARAEDLAHRATSASMQGWFNRHRRREMLAKAQVHATLATIRTTSPAEPDPAGDLLVEEELSLAERDRDDARAQAGQLRHELAEVRQTLHDAGVPDEEIGDYLPTAIARLLVQRRSHLRPVAAPFESKFEYDRP